MLKYLNNFEAKQIMNISILWQLLEANHLTFERKEKHEHLSMHCLLLQLIWFSSPLGIHIPNKCPYYHWIPQKKKLESSFGRFGKLGIKWYSGCCKCFGLCGTLFNKANARKRTNGINKRSGRL
jgi:hypothetical protein